MAIVAGQRVTAGEMNAELGLDTFRAGQKVRESVLADPDFPAGEPVRAEDFNQAFGGGGPGPGPDPDGTPANPGEALWIGDEPGKNHYNVGIGQGNAGEDNDTDHDDFSPAQIESGLVVPDRFFLAQHGGAWWTEFRINAGAGRTSTGTDFPRSELREFNEAANDEIAWNGASGLHYMLWTPRIVAVTEQRPWVCFGQIHDASSDLIRLQTQGSTGQTTGLDIVARYTKGGDETTVVLIDGGYDVGDVIGPCELRVDAGTLTVWIDGTRVLEVDDMGVSGCYFKAGCYLQSNVHEQDEDPDDEAAVQILAGSLVTWHTGYATPTTPVYTG